MDKRVSSTLPKQDEFRMPGGGDPRGCALMNRPERPGSRRNGVGPARGLNGAGRERNV